jgi:biotin operon repressor
MKLNNPIIQQWVRAGILFNAPPAAQSPDLERLLLETVRVCPDDPRLFILVVTWLSEYGSYVARHRLKHLALCGLDGQDRSVLGVLLETAIEAGAPGELRSVLAACEPADAPVPLFVADRGEKTARSIVESTATEASRRWNLLLQPVALKPESIRPPAWVLQHNPSYRDRALRKGDLRCSIVETLSRDADVVGSESELARLCSASRTAVRHALDELHREGLDLRRRSRPNRRDQPISLVG